MHGGDEVGAVVLDIGTAFTKAGLAGEDQPKAVFSTAVGSYFASDSEIEATRKSYNITPKDEDPEVAAAQEGASSSSSLSQQKLKRYCVGRSQFYPRPGMEIEYPVQNGLVENWDAIANNINYAFTQHLRLDTKEHPFMVAEPTFVPNIQREKLLELLFEKFSCPASFFAKAPVLAAFSAGRPTALVLDSGAGQTTATPVHDGYVLNRGVRKTKVAGNILDEMIERLLFAQAFPEKQIVPLYALKKEYISENELKVERLNVPGITASYHRFQVLEVLRDMKEALCKITETPFDINGHIKLPPQPYTLPDGITLDVGNERFIAGEHLFIPHLKSGLLPLQSEDDFDRGTSPFHGFHRLVIGAVESVDADLRKELYGNLVLTGGTTLIPGLPARLIKDVNNNIAPVFKTKILAGNTVADRKFGV